MATNPPKPTQSQRKAVWEADFLEALKGLKGGGLSQDVSQDLRACLSVIFDRLPGPPPGPPAAPPGQSQGK